MMIVCISNFSHIGEYVHSHNNVDSVEHSIATFSWLQGNPYPAFALLSLRPSDAAPRFFHEPSYKIQICQLPPQLYIYPWYAILYGFTVIYLLHITFFRPNANYHNLEQQTAFSSSKQRHHKLFIFSQKLFETTALGLLTYFIVILWVWIQ